jgi:tRNA nucleotidyltransferase/poly(A) polymerase
MAILNRRLRDRSIIQGMSIPKASWLNSPETQRIVTLFKDGGFNIRFGGGCVRDLITGDDIHDIDIVTPASTAEIVRVLDDAGMPHEDDNIASGLIRLDLAPWSYDILSLSQWFSLDGIDISTLSIEDIWALDRSRRDLSINAMQMTIDGRIIDDFHGIDDIRAGRIHLIGDLKNVLEKDFWRVLRYFRFQALYGKVPMPEALLKQIKQQLPSQNKPYPAYVQHQMHRFLSAKHPYATLEMLRVHKILPVIMGFEVTSCEPLKKLEAIESEVHFQAQPSVRLLCLLLESDCPASAALEILRKRWNIIPQSIEILVLLVRHLKDLRPDVTPAQEQQLRQIFGHRFKSLVFLSWALDSDVDNNAAFFTRLLSSSKSATN